MRTKYKVANSSLQWRCWNKVERTAVVIETGRYNLRKSAFTAPKAGILVIGAHLASSSNTIKAENKLKLEVNE